jgi:hypothetical protein
MTTEISKPKQPSRFRPGVSGNPRGKPKGIRNRATLLLNAISDASAEGVLRAMIAKALGGDVQAARLILDRVMPPPKGRSLALDLGAMETPAEVQRACGVILGAMGRGEIAAGEAALMIGAIVSAGKAGAGDIEIGITIGGGISGLMKAAKEYTASKALLGN